MVPAGDREILGTNIAGFRVGTVREMEVLSLLRRLRLQRLTKMGFEVGSFYGKSFSPCGGGLPQQGQHQAQQGESTLRFNKESAAENMLRVKSLSY